MGHSSSVNDMTFSPDRKLVASGSSDRTLRLWTPATATLHRMLTGGFNGDVTVTFSPNGKLIAYASFDNTVRFWDPATGTVRSTLKFHSIAISAIAFSPDGKLVASASRGGTVMLEAIMVQFMT